MYCMRLAENTGRKKSPKFAIWVPSYKFVWLWQLRQSTIGKNLLNRNISSRCPHIMANFGRLTAEIGLRCSLGHRRPTKLCTVFGHLLSWYTIYTFLGAFAPWQNFATCKVHFASKSCVLVYWQRYCMVLQQRASAKLCGMVQGMELRNFRRGRHLYSLDGHHVGLGIGPHSSLWPPCIAGCGIYIFVLFLLSSFFLA